MTLARSNSILYIPPPTGGLNGFDSWYDMDPNYAVQIQNVNPLYNFSKCRSSFASVGISAVNYAIDVSTLDVNIEANGTVTFIVSYNNHIYSITSAGVWTDRGAVLTGGSLYPISTCQFRSRLFIANGIDAPMDWTGAALTNPTGWSGTGLTASTLRTPWAYKGRLFFTTATNDIWFAPVDAITGALTKYPMQSYLTKGGQIIFGGQTYPQGMEREALWLVVSNQGEVLVYSGQDPAASDWQFYGRFFISMPISYASYFDYGGNFHIVTAQGIVAMDDVLAGKKDGANYVTISKNIDPLIGSIASGIGAFTGGGPSNVFTIRAAISAAENLLYLGPIPGGIGNYRPDYSYSSFFVMNLSTKAWSWYTTPTTYYPIGTITSANGVVYYIAAGAKYELWKTGESALYDVGSSNLPISWSMASAFTNVKQNYHKKFNKFRPVVKNGLTYTIGAYADFDTSVLKSNSIATPLALNKKFYDLNMEGTFLSAYVSGTSANSGATALPEYYGSFITYQPGSDVP